MTREKKKVVFKRKILSTPYKPPDIVLDEITSLFLDFLKRRKYGEPEEFKRDMEVISEKIQLCLLTRTLKGLSLDTGDAILEVEFYEDLALANDAKPCRPLILLKPMPPNSSIYLTLKIKDSSLSFIKEFSKLSTKNLRLNVVSEDQRPIEQFAIEQLLFYVFPRMGLKFKVSEKEIGVLSEILSRYKQIRAITLTSRKICIIIPSENIRDQKSLILYENLMKNVKNYVSDECVFGVLTSERLQDEHLVESQEKIPRKIVLGSLQLEGLKHYYLRLG